MSLYISGNETIKQILTIVEELPNSVQESLLHQLKMKKALLTAKKIDKAKKGKSLISDQEIADIIHQYRRARK